MNKKLKILIDDGNQIGLGTGIGKYSLYLYNAMRDNGYDVSLVKQVAKPVGRLKDRLNYLLRINSKEYMRELQIYDVVLYTNYAMPIRKNRTTAYVTAIPDMVSFLHPETLPTMYRYYNQAMIRNTVKRADLVFTISKSVENEIVSKFPQCKERIRTTWLGLYDGIGPLDTYNEYENLLLKGIDEFNYFLFVSTVEKRKNVGVVLDAFIELKKFYPEAKSYKLVIVGRPGFGYEEFVQKANASEYSDDIIFAGYTSDSDCNRLYNHAKAFIFPTIYEGFGFAQIECMKCHLPIILSNITTNFEISRKYGEFFDLNDINTLVEKMLVFVNNQYNYVEKRELADRYLEDFQWSKIARQYMEYFEELFRKKNLYEKN